MAKKNKKENKKNIKESNDGATINLKESSVAEFTKRPLPTDQEVESATVFKPIMNKSDYILD